MVPVTKELSNRFANMALLCAFGVVIIHCRPHVGSDTVGWWTKQILENGVCLVSVPFFFFASGFFLASHTQESGWWRRAIFSRVVSLMVPYVIWISLFSVAIFFTGNAGDLFSVKGILRAYGFNPFWFPCLSPLWYVRALFVLVILSPLLSILACKWWCLLLLFVIYGVLCPGPSGNGLLFGFFRFGLSLAGLFYMTLGMAVRQEYILLRFGKFRCWFGIVLGLTLIIVQAVLIRSGWHHAQYLGWLAIPCMGYGVLGVMLTSQLPRYLVGCAFPVYLIHKFLYLFVPDSWRGGGRGAVSGCLCRRVLRLCCYSQHRALGLSSYVSGSVWRKILTVDSETVGILGNRG